MARKKKASYSDEEELVLQFVAAHGKLTPQQIDEIRADYIKEKSNQLYGEEPVKKGANYLGKVGRVIMYSLAIGMLIVMGVVLFIIFY